MRAFRIIRALTAVASAITVLGVTVVILDEYATGSDPLQYAPMAPITSPVIENIDRPVEYQTAAYEPATDNQAPADYQGPAEQQPSADYQAPSDEQAPAVYEMPENAPPAVYYMPTQVVTQPDQG